MCVVISIHSVDVYEWMSMHVVGVSKCMAVCMHNVGVGVSGGGGVWFGNVGLLCQYYVCLHGCVCACVPMRLPMHSSLVL